MSNRCLTITEAVEEATKDSNMLSNNSLISEDATEDRLNISELVEIDYSNDNLLEQHLQEQFYASTSTYSFSSENQVKSTTSFYDNEEIKYAQPSPEENASETLTTPQAEETMEEVCLAKMMGTNIDVSYIARRKLANWILFNQAYFHFFESNALTRDVSYTAF